MKNVKKILILCKKGILNFRAKLNKVWENWISTPKNKEFEFSRKNKELKEKVFDFHVKYIFL